MKAVLLDTSAVIAILLDEPDASAMVDVVSRAGWCFIGAPSLVVAAAVLLSRKGVAGKWRLMPCSSGCPLE